MVTRFIFKYGAKKYVVLEYLDLEYIVFPWISVSCTPTTETDKLHRV